MNRDRVHKAAFTLAELMIVIVLIAVLASFLLPAVLKSQQQARVAECRTTIQNLSLAIDSFHNDFGFYPPTANAYNPTTGAFDGDAYGDYAYAEALVQCLCNVFAKGVGDGTPAVGNSFRNLVGGQFIQRLLGTAPVNGGPYFEVKAKDLVDLDYDGFPELADPWGNPYIYIPSTDYMLPGGTQYRAGALIMIDGNTDGFINQDDWPDLTVDPLVSGYYHQQRFRFQLVSRGPDGWTPGIDHRDTDADGQPDGYTDVSINGNPYGFPPSGTDFNPALIGTDTDLTAPFVFAAWGQTTGTADDINNW